MSITSPLIHFELTSKKEVIRAFRTSKSNVSCHDGSAGQNRVISNYFPTFSTNEYACISFELMFAFLLG